MAAAKKRAVVQKAQRQPKCRTKRQGKRQPPKRQLMSVIWFAVAGLFCFCIVFIKGQNVWLAIHNFIFGVFGVTAYFYPFLLGFVAVLFAMDKIGGSINAKITESGVLVILIGAAVDIFVKHGETLSFWRTLPRLMKAVSPLKAAVF